MKFSLTFIIMLLLCSFTTMAQVVPSGMKYQAVARNLQGEVLADQEIALQIALVSSDRSIELQYLEEHHVVTNKLGLFTLTIGEGQVIKGSFDQIPWSTEQVWVELSIDERGGNDFVLIHSSRLLAVPYAFHSATAGKISNNKLSSRGMATTWDLKGNKGTTAGVDYVGTRDDEDLVFKTNMEERMRIEADGIVNIQIAQVDSLNATELQVANNATIEGKLNVTDFAFFQDSIHTNGGLTVLESTKIGENLGVIQNVLIGGNLEVDGETTLNSGLSVGSDLSVGNDVFVGRNITIDENASIGNDLTVDNNATISQNANVGVDLSVGNNISATNNASIGNDLTVDNNATISQNASVGVDLSVGNDLTVDNNATISQNANVGVDLSVGNNISATNNASIGNDLTVDNNATISQNANVGVDLSVGNNISATNNATIGNDLTVNRNTAISNNLAVGGSSNLTGLVSMANGANVTGLTNSTTLNVTSTATIGGNLAVAGISTVSNTTQSTSKDNGSMVLEGGLGVEKNANIGGSLTVRGTGTVGPNNAVVPNNNHAAYIYNTSGDINASGLAIQINNGSAQQVNTITNNYVTFYNQNGTVAGRIEGFDLEQNGAFTAFPSVSFSDFFNLGSIDLNPFQTLDPATFSKTFFGGGFLPPPLSAVFSPATLSTLFTGGALNVNSPSFAQALLTPPQSALATSNPKLNELICWALENGLEGLITTSPFDLALAGRIIQETQKCTDNGVIYGGTGADYAEWLEKVNPEEGFTAGQIVGIHGGKITKVTEGADQVLPVSLAPVVLGNMPPDSEKELYEKVGFMGQVPVLIWGKAKVGDFIIPSGKNDGFGLAVSPEDMTIENMKYVVGRVWEEGTEERMNMVNSSIGLATNEWVEIIKKQAAQLENLEGRMIRLEDMEAKLEVLSNRMEATAN
ncbi:MAG: UDP-3-O-[3-hydroxymyristoyl] glucosamine N-acyltransferase [Gammaproteobacteria bacterium]|jgi:UDP-3-O-[3-hydroxymyristoyl] glucosamine N-acyltransferase